MNIPETFRGIPKSFVNYCYSSQQATMSVVIKLKELRQDTEFFQKVCQIAFAALQLAMIRYPFTNSLSRLAFTLQTANMHDFYGFFKQPRQWLFPINATCIDADQLLNDLIILLCKNLKEDFSEDVYGNVTSVSSDLYKTTQLVLETQLREMFSNDDAYRNVEEFKDILTRRFQTLEDRRFSNLDLSCLEISLKHTMLFDKLTNLAWGIVDIGCIGFYFKGWKLFDTAKLAECIGQYPAFAWVKNQDLNHWVFGLVCSAFAMKFIEAVRKLQDEILTDQEQERIRWEAVHSLAELVLFGGIFSVQMNWIKIDNTYIQVAAIIAKSLGLIKIVTRPERQFFQDTAQQLNV